MSMAFLYHLCIAAQIERATGKVGSVFELGSGYGGLARILKLLNPGAKIVLCDLPTTLYFCYVYLRRHFPNATFEVIERPGQPRGSADFTFVPAPLARELAGSTFDLVANTSSLSEMTQDAADWYLRLIQDDMKVDYLYHLNRLGTPEALGNACATSYGLDKHWEVLTWHWQNAGSFNLVTYPETPALLNLIARRIPKQIRSDLIYTAMARPLRARLAALNAPAPVPPLPEPEKASFWRKAPPPIVVAPAPEALKLPSDEWLFALWDLIRIERKPADIAAYLDVIRPLHWREVAYYDSLLKEGKSRS